MLGALAPCCTYHSDGDDDDKENRSTDARAYGEWRVKEGRKEGSKEGRG